MALERCAPRDVVHPRAFLREADLTHGGLEAPSLRLRIERDADGAIVGSTGYEVDTSGRHALVRSVAVAPSMRGRGMCGALARFARGR